MTATKVLFADGLHFLVEVLKRVIGSQSGLSVVGEVNDFRQLPRLFEKDCVDWVILTQLTESLHPAELIKVLKDQPALSALLISPHEGGLSVLRLEEKSGKLMGLPLGKELTLDDLLAILLGEVTETRADEKEYSLSLNSVNDTAAHLN